MSANAYRSSYRVDVKSLYRIVNEVRIKNGLTWVEVCREVGVYEDYFSRLNRDYLMSVSGNALVSILMWLQTWDTKDHFYDLIEEHLD